MDLLNIIRFKLKHRKLRGMFNTPQAQVSKVTPLEGDNNCDYEELP